MIGNRELSEEQTNFANIDQRQENVAETECQQIKQRKNLCLSNKKKKVFRGSCDTRFAWQVELDCLQGGFYSLFTRHVWPFEL